MRTELGCRCSLKSGCGRNSALVCPGAFAAFYGQAHPQCTEGERIPFLAKQASRSVGPTNDSHVIPCRCGFTESTRGRQKLGAVAARTQRLTATYVDQASLSIGSCQVSHFDADLARSGNFGCGTKMEKRATSAFLLPCHNPCHLKPKLVLHLYYRRLDLVQEDRLSSFGVLV